MNYEPDTPNSPAGLPYQTDIRSKNSYYMILKILYNSIYLWRAKEIINPRAYNRYSIYVFIYIYTLGGFLHDNTRTNYKKSLL